MGDTQLFVSSKRDKATTDSGDSAEEDIKDADDGDGAPTVGFIGHEPEPDDQPILPTTSLSPSPELRLIQMMKIQQEEEDDDDDDDNDDGYVLTVSNEEWSLGNPTGATTSSNDDTTVTYLLFTETELVWRSSMTEDVTRSDQDTSTPTSTDGPTATEEDEEDATTADEATGTDTTNSPSTLIEVTNSAGESPTEIDAVDPSSSNDSGDGGQDISAGTIIGIVSGIGGLTIVVVVALLVFFRRRQKKSKGSRTTSDDLSPQQEHKEPGYSKSIPQEAMPGKGAGEQCPASGPAGFVEMEHHERGPAELGVQESASAMHSQQAFQSGQPQHFVAELPADVPIGYGRS